MAVEMVKRTDVMKRLPFRLTSFAQGTLSKVERVRHRLFNLALGASLVLWVGMAFWAATSGSIRRARCLRYPSITVGALL
jgi:hypothetical protein